MNKKWAQGKYGTIRITEENCRRQSVPVHERLVSDELIIKHNEKKYRNAKKEYLKYDTKEWSREYFNDSNGGYLVVNNKRIEQGKINDEEIYKYNKEYSMSKTLAENGYKVEFLKEVDGQYDILLNGVAADLKKTKSHNHIIDYAKHAIKNQGANVVIFEFKVMTSKIHEKLNYLAKHNYNIIYYISDEKILHYINTTP
jgi:hypothetical protein